MQARPLQYLLHPILPLCHLKIDYSIKLSRSTDWGSAALHRRMQRSSVVCVFPLQYLAQCIGGDAAAKILIVFSLGRSVILSSEASGMCSTVAGLEGPVREVHRPLTVDPG